MKPIRLAPFFILTVFAFSLRAQETSRNPYHLGITASRDSYLQMIRNDSLQSLADLAKTVPGISLDIRYALFIIDKFAGAGYLLKEMTIIE